jgi:hypothetical protein
VTGRLSNADPEVSTPVGRRRARTRSLIYSPGADALNGAVVVRARARPRRLYKASLALLSPSFLLHTNHLGVRRGLGGGQEAPGQLLAHKRQLGFWLSPRPIFSNSLALRSSNLFSLSSSTLLMS